MKISLIGLGPGNREFLCARAGDLISEADVIIGAERMTEPFIEGKTVYNLFRAEEILEKLKNTGIGSRIAILLSGDPGFYSTAQKLLKLLDGDETFRGSEVNVIPGISSMQYFLENLHISWENTRFLSLHGRQANIIGYIRRYTKVFTLLGSGSEIREICEKLHYYGMDGVKIIIGERLSYPDENITLTDPKSFIESGKETDRLSVALFLNDGASDTSLYSIDDEEFVRGDVPMTKEEVRTVSISKLRLSPDSVLYDIGAGTGSISVEAALKLINGRVFAVEKESVAVELIRKNKRKFGTDNITIINDTAPRGLEDLPAPSHVFIGGSGGNMRDIIDFCVNRNPGVRIVINLISLDTLSEVMAIINEKQWKADISMAGISRLKEISGHKLMVANNPVYVIVIEPGAGKAED